MMKNHWSIEWDLLYGGLRHSWSELTPTARRRLRRLVGRGKDGGRLSDTDFKIGR